MITETQDFRPKKPTKMNLMSRETYIQIKGCGLAEHRESVLLYCSRCLSFFSEYFALLISKCAEG